MPKTKPAYTAEFKGKVLADQANTHSSLQATATHCGVSASSRRQ
jgi:hypothetical protein